MRLLPALLLTCAASASAQQSGGAPDLAFFKLDRGIGPTVWKLGADPAATADVGKQVEMPRRYKTSRSSHKPGASPEAYQVSTGDITLTPLGEGFVYVRTVEKSIGGLAVGVEETLTWRGVVPAATAHLIMDAIGGGDASGVRTVSRTSEFKGAMPDFRKMREGFTFSFALERNNASAKMDKDMKPHDEDQYSRPYRRTCTAGAAQPAAKFAATLKGQAYPLACKSTEGGKEYEETLVYLDAYAMAVRDDFFGGRESPTPGIYMETQVEVLPP